MTHVIIDPAELKPLIVATVREVLEQLDWRLDSQRLAFSESEAAGLLGMRPHQLRDLRLAGKVNPPKLGKSFRYSRALLLRLLEAT